MVTHVSAVICTRNRPDLIGNAVASVLGNSYPSFDLLVVDQSDNDRTGEVVRGLMSGHPNLRYLHTNLAGLSRAYNTGVRETTADLLAFTDDDCVVPPDWIACIVAAFDGDPEADMLYGQVLKPAALAHDTRELPVLWVTKPERLSRRDGFRIFGMGANFAARRRLFDRTGGFDEILGGGGPLKSSQDFDFQYRAYLAGATILLRPEVKVDDYGFRESRDWPVTQHNYGFGDGAFFSKHVRCRDPFATKMFLKWFGGLAAREALSQLGVRRRPDSRLLHLRSFVEGFREAFTFPIDRRRRMYLAKPRAA